MFAMAPANVITDITDKLDSWSANWWFLAVVFAIAFLDSVVPIVPSEATVIVAGVAVATGEAKYALWAVIVAGAVGAFLGDNAAYAIGHHWGGWFHRRAEHRPKLRSRLDWAEAQIKRRGGLLLITARFIPGGRTALTLSSGITRQHRWWFIRWVAVATTIWASYAAGLAYVVGKPFKDDHTKAFWIAFGTALGINVLIEIVRHRRQRSRSLLPAVAD
ncbi:MAG: DedA family protein [Actinomycetota bacterium]|nr:DedA family protein [Actinomycetota bacterium]